MSHIALLDHLHTDKSVRLNIPLKDGVKQTYHALARVQDQDERTVVVNLKGKAFPGSEQINFREKCSVNLDVEGSVLSMNATIEEVLERDRLLLKGSDYVAYQPKRNAFRVQTDIPVQYKRYYREQEAFRNVRSEDLSSGGVRLLCHEDLQTGNVLTLSLEIPRPKQGRVVCTAQVTWTGVRHDGGRVAGCHFLDLEEASEDLIIAFCFERQRELMKEKVETADR
ncbi:MAG: PilZ domain-containing protein [Desulfohalobiaceae bacterium]|nr:PilZ domain-containing protein [Desulfohalobiaceae bacterium]